VVSHTISEGYGSTMIAHIGGLEFEVFVSYASWNLVPGIIDSEYCYHLISLDVIL